ncbi:hypothetical protein [Runella salmonicolor]|uniref:Uncharacterized protein n=1 Tax=Runella salmonicolor TaxID=2950278 RepID=A0ABT1FSS2_9BACT|nr:hypothetical protein [Runella salmonicolor]MCP1384810.1 hypothetical protein [Runella salmonicolor]
MKSILTLGFFFSLIIAANAQTVNGVPLRDSKLEYIQFVEYQKPMKDSKRVIFYDFGKNRIDALDKDENGNSIEDIKAIDALNLLAKHGYEFVQTYTVFRNGETAQCYLMKKKHSKEEK